jgi:transcriptional regulator with XRE-family HTH domain
MANLTGSLNDRAVIEIRAEMGRQQLSGVKLAEILGWTQNAISRRLRGEAPLTLSELDQISRALRRPLAQFVLPDLVQRRRAG